ncbi:hypothetical protein [Celeribacter indicus]|nr:hypothetical protein [Celeribacter indicus]
MNSAARSGRRFAAREDGAVTVDWVVLVSAMVGVAIMVLALVWQGSAAFAFRVNSEIEKIEVATSD